MWNPVNEIVRLGDKCICFTSKIVGGVSQELSYDTGTRQLRGVCHGYYYYYEKLPSLSLYVPSLEPHFRPDTQVDSPLRTTRRRESCQSSLRCAVDVQHYFSRGTGRDRVLVPRLVWSTWR